MEERVYLSKYYLVGAIIACSLLVSAFSFSHAYINGAFEKEIPIENTIELEYDEIKTYFSEEVIDNEYIKTIYLTSNKDCLYDINMDDNIELFYNDFKYIKLLDNRIEANEIIEYKGIVKNPTQSSYDISFINVRCDSSEK